MGRLVAWFDRFQQRHRVLGMPIAVFKRFGEHDGGRLAATLSYYGFFSVFPLALVFTSILGLVLQDNESLRRDLIDGSLGQIPLIGSQLQDGTLTGSAWALVIGLLTSLWAGLGAISSLQQALDIIADVPVRERPNFFMKKLKAVAFLVVLALGLALSVGSSNLATLVRGGVITGALGLVAAFIVNVLIVMLLFSVLPAQRRTRRELLPGSIAAAFGLVVLQQLGSIVVRHFLANASDTYGTFATIIALLSWFFLISRLLLLSAQLNVVVADRLSPRSLLASSPPTDADRRAKLLDVHRIQRDDGLSYAVAIGDAVATDADPLAENEPTKGQPATSR